MGRNLSGMHVIIFFSLLCFPMLPCFVFLLSVRFFFAFRSTLSVTLLTRLSPGLRSTWCCFVSRFWTLPLREESIKILQIGRAHV